MGDDHPTADSRPGSGGSTRLVWVDSLRGGAALAVVLLHVPHEAAQGNPFLRPVFAIVDRFFEAVWLFMVISGFCIHLSAAKLMGRGQPPGRRWGAFWRRRFVRLYPAYLAAVVLGLVVYYTCGPGPDGQVIRFPAFDVAAHLLMVQHLFVEYWGGVGNGPLWTLGVEEHLYVLYAPYLIMRRRFGPRVILALVLSISVGWFLLISWRYNLSFGSPPLEVGRLPWWPPRFWFFWCLGAVAAEVYAGAVTLPRWCRSGPTVLGLLAALLCTYLVPAFPAELDRLLGRASRHVVFAMSFLHEPLFGCVAALLLLRGVRNERAGRSPGRAGRLLATVGVFSYSLYVTHAPVVRVLETVLGVADGESALAWRYLIWVPTCVGFAYLFFLAFEQWFISGPSSPGDHRIAPESQAAGRAGWQPSGTT